MLSVDSSEQNSLCSLQLFVSKYAYKIGKTGEKSFAGPARKKTMELAWTHADNVVDNNYMDSARPHRKRATEKD